MFILLTCTLFLQEFQYDEDLIEFIDADDTPLADRLKDIDGTWEKIGILNNTKSFQSRCGPNIPENIEEPLGMFNINLSNDFIDHLVYQTNYYAQSEHKPFTPVTKIEMNIFLGLNVLMGIKKLPSYKDYWSSNIQLRDHYISSKMSLNRFSWFLSHLHVNNNDLQPKRHEPNFDKLYKIRPFLDHLSDNFLSYFDPGKNQSIDESMILFKGRSSIKQYMPMKPIKRGYKVWVRADESGYICEFQVYTGKLNSVETSLGKRVVIDLTRNLVGKYHHVYFDNFFTSIELMEQLLNDGIYACGTVRANRKGLPNQLIR